MDKINVLPFRRHLRMLTLTLTVLLLASCNPTRLVTGSKPTETTVTSSHNDNPLAAIAQPNISHTDFTARMTADLAYNDHVLTIKGNLRMRRGDVIQMAFTALGMVEIARLELTPKAVLLIDRMSKQYATVAYDQLPGLQNVGLCYDILESLLWNELFLPGQKKVTTHLNHFDTQANGQQLIITPKTQTALQLQFTADNSCTRLQQTDMAYKHITTTWQYATFQTVGNARFPAMLRTTATDGNKEATATLTYTNMAFDNTEWTAHTNIANYTQLTIEEFLSKLTMLK